MSDPDTIVRTDNTSGVTPGVIEGGAFEVTADGAATYTLPLWVPAGRRGIQPELALHYHSRAGNGALGVGLGDLGSRFEGVTDQYCPIPWGPNLRPKDAQEFFDIRHFAVRYAWSLSSVRDRSGNMMTVSYDHYQPGAGLPPGPREYLPTQ